jgi:hypothetical protein
LNIFVMQKCSDGNEHFTEHFFQSWNEIANFQKIARWYKVYIQGNSKPNEKQKMRAVNISLPGMQGCVHLVPKYLRHGPYDLRHKLVGFFLYQNHQDNHPRFETYTNLKKSACTYLRLTFWLKGWSIRKKLLRAHHRNSARRAGCTSGTPCSLVSCLRV